MSNDISGFGLSVNIIADSTFPAGLLVTQFADDADPFDTPAIALADKAMGLNGDLVVWSKATPIEITVNVIPGSDDDQNLAILAEANRVGAGKVSAQDNITATAIYPDGSMLTLTNGRILMAPVGSSVASAGRLKTKAYQFTFENRAAA
jgi:hypothetical protein